MSKQAYQIEYDEFVAEYRKGITDAEDVGALIVRLAQHFMTINIELGEKWRNMVKVAAEINSQMDDNTGKAIAANKAQTKIDATPEAMDLYTAKIDIENLEQLLNALKSLQRGVTNDYHHMGNT